MQSAAQYSGYSQKPKNIMTLNIRLYIGMYPYFKENQSFKCKAKALMYPHCRHMGICVSFNSFKTKKMES